MMSLPVSCLQAAPAEGDGITYALPTPTIRKQEAGACKVRSADTWSICVCILMHTSLTKHLQALLCDSVLVVCW